MIVFKILLIILVALPVVALAVYLWYQMAEYVRKKNRQDALENPSLRKRRRR
jgi:hypothetical protein